MTEGSGLLTIPVQLMGINAIDVVVNISTESQPDAAVEGEQ